MTYLLKNAQLLDAEHNHAPLDVLIDGTTIAAVGTDLSSVDQVIDLSGYTILPGFVDAHVHVAVDDRAFKEDAVRAWAYNGVTTVRELGMLSTLSQQDYAQWIRENNQKPDTAHVVATGKYIDVAGGYGAGPMPNHPVGNLITNPAEAADAVTLAHNLGYPGIKIGIHDGSMEQTPHLTPDMAKAICTRAHELGMWVAAHIGNCKGARFMLDAGVDELAHTPADPMPEDMIREMAEKGIVMDTTVGDPDKGIEPPPMMDLPEGMEPPEGMGPPPGPMMPMDPAEMKRQQAEKMQVMEKNLGRFYRAGGKIVVGTDLIHSRDYRKDAVIPVAELRHLHAAGLPMNAILRAATLSGDEVVGTGNIEGRIATGYLANLVAVPGKVDETFDALRQVKLVIHRGAIIRDER